MRTLAATSLASGEPTAWFEQLYAEADGDPDAISWADLAPNPRLREWLADHPVAAGTSVRVPGCGLGDEPALLAATGADVTAFDVAPSAVAWARRRFPDAAVRWEVADLLRLPTTWVGAFDLVVEVNTLQCLPGPERATAIAALAACVAPGGRLVAIGRLRDPAEAPSGPPWPLALGELERFDAAGLERVDLADGLDDEDPPVCRFVATYRGPAA